MTHAHHDRPRLISAKAIMGACAAWAVRQHPINDPYSVNQVVAVIKREARREFQRTDVHLNGGLVTGTMVPVTMVPDIPTPLMVRHVRTGRVEAVLTRQAIAQCSVRPIEEMDRVTIYSSMETGQMYVRRTEEFDDGRFVPQ